MRNYQIDPRKQFSKRLARWTAIFWFFYMTWLSVLFILSPSSAMYSVYMGIIVTIVMMTNVIAYTRNSIMEKLAFAMLDKVKLEMSLKGSTTTNGSPSSEDDEPDEPEEEGDVG